MEIANTLAQLVREACEHPDGSRQRQKKLTQIIRSVDRHLWKENTAYYEDALQETWIYLCQNLCEGKTTKPYDPNRASVITWLNNYLKWRLKDGYIETHERRQKTVFALKDDNGLYDPVDSLPAKPDIPPILEEVKRWALQDPEYKLRQTHLDNHPQITCQLLILERLPHPTSWKTLAEKYNISAGTLSSFYQRKCKPLLREFSKFQGYI